MTLAQPTPTVTTPTWRRWRACKHWLRRQPVAAASLGLLLMLGTLGLLAPLLARALGSPSAAQNLGARLLPWGARTMLSTGDQEAAVERFVKAEPERAAQMGASLRAIPLFAKAKGTLPEDDTEMLFIALETLQDGAQPSVGEGPGWAWLLAQRESWQRRHWLGTDELGRDQLVRLAYGARVSLGVGLGVALISGLLGLLVGLPAGFHGGWVDNALMRFTDAILALPLLPLLIVLSAMDLGRLPLLGQVFPADFQAQAKLMLILCLTCWMEPARIVRACALAESRQDYLLAGRALGVKPWRLIVRHLAPNVAGPFLVACTLTVGRAVLYESSLSFLGLGLQPPVASWGRMLNDAQSLLADAPAQALCPGTLIFLVVLAVNLFGEGLGAALNARGRHG